MMKDREKTENEPGSRTLDSAISPAQDWKTMEESLSTGLAEIGLPDCDGKEIRLGSLWAGQAAVLVFLRHYG
jgi:hypothetical protein